MSAISTSTKLDPEPIRDPESDHLLTPQNCAIALIDYQEGQYATVGSTSREEIDLGVVTLAQLARAYEIPTVVSTVAVGMGVHKPTVDEITRELPGITEVDRTGVNSWEDADFRAAIEATGRKKIVMAGLWTEVCLAFSLAFSFELMRNWARADADRYRTIINDHFRRTREAGQSSGDLFP